jgi:hypothetical protein
MLMLYTMGLQPFYGKGSHRLFRAGSRAARGQTTISGIPNRLNYRGNFYSVYIHIYNLHIWPRSA